MDNKQVITIIARRNFYQGITLTPVDKATTNKITKLLQNGMQSWQYTGTALNTNSHLEAAAKALGIPALATDGYYITSDSPKEYKVLQARFIWLTSEMITIARNTVID